ncbi:myotubularin-related protein 3-like isoform X2, partial [Argonauta hians]
LNSRYLNLKADGPAFSENHTNTHQMPATMACQDEPSNLECIHKSELFPKKELVTEDRYLQFPFPLLCGESVEYLGKVDDGIIALSNFRVLIKCKDLFANVPIGLIEFVETRDIFHIAIYCKDATVVKCSFATNELCQDWFKRLNAAICAPSRMEDLFAFAFHAWCVDHCNREQNSSCHQLCVQNSPMESYQLRFGRELKRMNFDLKSAWRITYINEDYEICPSYPEVHIVPAIITDEELRSVADFRSMRRIPSVVWRDQRNGAVIVRSSQPELGWLGWRKTEDENLLQAIAMACARNPGFNHKSQSPSDISGSTEAIEKDEMCMGVRDSTPTTTITNNLGMLIIDARSYSAAIANRAKGGGCECAEYYPNCEIQFMNLANIHSIRKSICALRTLCGSSPDQTNWLSGLENTKWLHHIASLLKAACVIANAIHKEGRPVLVHCSDGWDRTPQIVSLAQLLLDPYYRTSYGFYILVEREWLQFGHKFADRNGHDVNNADPNERCPVFLQWLDCVHQIYTQYPCAFEFSEAFLIKLVQHTYSRLFGTFLCNNSEERRKAKLKTKTASVWSLLLPGNNRFTNSLYNPSADQVIYPSCHVLNLSLWTHVFLSNNSFSATSDDIVGTGGAGGGGGGYGISGGGGGGAGVDGDHAHGNNHHPHHHQNGNLSKTRSYDDLVGVEHPTANRRLSDPSVAGTDNHDQPGTTTSNTSSSSSGCGGGSNNYSSSPNVYSLINMNSSHLLEETITSSPPRAGGEDLLIFNGNDCTSTPDSDMTEECGEVGLGIGGVGIGIGIGGSGSGGVLGGLRSNGNSNSSSTTSNSSSSSHGNHNGNACGGVGVGSGGGGGGSCSSSSNGETEYQMKIGEELLNGDGGILSCADGGGGACEVNGNSASASSPSSSSSSSSASPDTASSSPASTLQAYFSSRGGVGSVGGSGSVTCSIVSSNHSSSSSSKPHRIYSNNGCDGGSICSNSLMTEQQHHHQQQQQHHQQQEFSNCSPPSTTSTSAATVTTPPPSSSSGGAVFGPSVDPAAGDSEPLSQLVFYHNASSSANLPLPVGETMPGSLYMNGTSGQRPACGRSGGGGGSSSGHSSNSHSSSSSEEDDGYSNININSSSNSIRDSRTLKSCKTISTSTSDISNSLVHGGVPPECSPLALVPLDVPPSSNSSIPRSSLKFNYLFENKLNISKTKSCPSTPNLPPMAAQCLKRALTPVAPPPPSTADGKVQSPLSRQCNPAQNPSSFNVTRHLDPDGLTTHPDTVQQRVNEIRSDYHQTIEIQKRHLEQLATLYQASAFNGTVRQIADKDELASLPESSGSGEPHSLGHCSNAASDVSWEHIDEKDSKMTLWVPDHAVTHCAGCEAAFWFVRRKHHCRNCGKVFCGKCANTYMPIPHQQLLEPARVCRSCLPKLQSSFPDNYTFFAFDQQQQQQQQHQQQQLQQQQQQHHHQQPLIAAAAAAAAATTAAGGATST